MGLAVEAQDRQPVVLNARDRRLEPVALKTNGLGLDRRDPLPPLAIGDFLAGLDPGRDHRRDGGGQHTAAVVAHQVNIHRSGQHGLHIVHEFQPLSRIQPGGGRLEAGETLQDHPVNL